MQRILIMTLTIMSLLFCGGRASAQTAVFVSASAADDSGDGSSWATAKRTVAAGIAAAGGNGRVYVMAGEYAVAVELTVPSGVTVIGGYDPGSTGTDTSQRQYPGVNSRWTDVTRCTIFDGGMSHRVATVNAGGKLEGCVVRRGKSTANGGGLLVDGGTVSHCVVMRCLAHSSVAGVLSKGGGVYVQNNGSLHNCVVCHNRADNGYGVAAASGDIVNNTITQNFGLDCGTVTDYDHNIYTTVVIGNQCWMRENLRTTHFADGTAILNTLNISYTEPRYYNVGASSTETVVFGLLYNVAAARNGTQDTYSESNPSGIQGVCPTGWHLPSNAEFEQLAAYLATDDVYLCGTDNANVAKSLASTEHWTTATQLCAVGNVLTDNNISLFTAQPAGYYDGSFNGLYTQGYYWTTSRNSGTSSQCVYRQLSYNNPTLQYNYATSEKGYSVRCVKN